MRILFLTQYFPPEVGAAQNRIAYFAKFFATAGHEVTVLTAMPSYPVGEIFPEYRRRWVSEEKVDGIRILRAFSYATKSKSFLQRLMNYFFFVFASALVGIARCGKQDMIVLESPPLFLGISGLFLKFVKKAKLALNVSDLWPESAVAMGMVRNRWAIQGATLLEERIYRHSDLITGQTRGIVQNIQTRFPAKLVALITNGTETAAGPNRTAGLAETKKEFGWRDVFLVGYAGVHGLAQGLETIVEAAALLDSHEKIQFVFFGDGPDKQNLVEMAETRRLKNLTFYPAQPRARILDIIACFDAALVPLRRLELFQGALPSKLFEAMGAGVPVVVSVSGEAQAIVEEAEGGICVPPEDPRAIVNAIVRLFNDPRLREEMGINGRKYMLENYNRPDIARNYVQLLEEAFVSEEAALPQRVGLERGRSREQYPHAD